MSSSFCLPCATCQLKRDIDRRKLQGIFWRSPGHLTHTSEDKIIHTFYTHTHTHFIISRFSVRFIVCFITNTLNTDVFFTDLFPCWRPNQAALFLTLCFLLTENVLKGEMYESYKEQLQSFYIHNVCFVCFVVWERTGWYTPQRCWVLGSDWSGSRLINSL